MIASDEPHRLVAARKGSPLVVGIGIGEHFVASDQMALRQVTDRVIFLEDGDIVDVTTLGVRISDAAGRDVQRPIEQLGEMADHADKGHFRHFMLKEIHEQPTRDRQHLARAYRRRSHLRTGFWCRGRTRCLPMSPRCRSWPAAPVTTPGW